MPIVVQKPLERKILLIKKARHKTRLFHSDIFELNESLEKDFETLQELEDHLDIIESSGRDTGAGLGLKARISSTRISIEKKKNQIKNMELEMNDLKNRLEPEE